MTGLPGRSGGAGLPKIAKLGWVVIFVAVLPAILRKCGELLGPAVDWFVPLAATALPLSLLTWALIRYWQRRAEVAKPCRFISVCAVWAALVIATPFAVTAVTPFLPVVCLVLGVLVLLGGLAAVLLLRIRRHARW